MPIDDATESTNGAFTLNWMVAPGRQYSIQRTSTLEPVNWVTVFGPQEATNNQFTMEWTDSDESTHYFYRIDCLY